MFRRIVFLCIFMTIVISAGSLSAQTPDAPSTPYYPTDEWASTTPEEQGMDSEALAAALAHIDSSGFNLHSLIIIRHGYIVTEVYVYPHTVDTLHGQQSAAKSFLSTVVGIAIDEGAIESVDQPLLDLFPNRTILNRDEQKDAITLHDALTMSTGMDIGENTPVPVTADQVQTILEQSMIAAPGTKFEYSSMTSYLLSVAVQNAVVIDSDTYARVKLFDPLGITRYTWDKDASGAVYGGSGLYVTPRDMARLGYLFLRKGVWNEKQIVSSDWVEAATHPQGPNEGYGYQWWITSTDPHIYHASGYGGQRIYVVPEDDLVVVFTAADNNRDLLGTFLKDDILPAVQSDTALPENPEALAHLQTEIDTLSGAKPQPVPDLPPIADIISRRTYGNFTEAWMGGISLIFTPGSGEALFAMTQNNLIVVLPVGLDGVMRLFEMDGQLTRAFYGEWLDDLTFKITQEYIGEATAFEYIFAFSEDGREVTATIQERVAQEIMIGPTTGTPVE